jgi:hypothetical protein
MGSNNENVGEATLKRLITFAACAALLAACSPQKPQPSTPVKYDVSIPIKEVMGDIVDPASFAYWHGSGTEITAAGEKNLSPTTEEGWVELENAAGVLMEVGNMLQLPGRARAPEGDWNKFAQLLTERAAAARLVATKHDAKGVFDEGGRVYEVCTACHKEFVIDPMLKAGGRPIGTPLPDWPADVKAKQKQLEGSH